MRIGCNWSKALKILLEKEAVNVDYIKSGSYGSFHEQFSTMRSMRPILIHGLGYFENTGMTNIEMIDFNAANSIIEKCDSPHYGLHLAIRKLDMYPGMGLTLKYVVVIVILMNLTALLLAVMIENLNRGKGFFRTIFYLPNMISMIIGGFMWKFVFTQVLYKLAEKTGMKFLDQSWIGDPKYAFWSIITVAIWGGAGYLMVIYIAAIQGVPTYLYEAAIVDGASRMRRFWSITLPMIRNSITICLFVTLNGAFQVFDVVYSLTGGGPGGATQVVAINIYKEAFARSNRFGYATAKSTILFLIILIVTFIQLKVTQRKEVEA